MSEPIIGERWIGISTGSKSLTLVELEVTSVDELTVRNDRDIDLQTGERPDAYRVLHQQITDFIRDNNIAEVVIKGSTGSKQAASKDLLWPAEVRGVVAAAAAAVCSRTSFWSKASASKRKGHRTVGEYLKDDDFWAKAALKGRKLRKGSRETAFSLLHAMQRGGLGD